MSHEIISLFLAEEPKKSWPKAKAFRQELKVGPRSRLYLLVAVIWYYLWKMLAEILSFSTLFKYSETGDSV